MKIAQVCPYNIQRPGGVQDHIFGLSSELRRRGHIVKIIAPRFEGGEIDDKDIILLGNSTSLFINKTQIEISVAVGRTKNPLKEVLDNERFDLLHIHNFWNPVLPLQIIYESKVANVGTIHSTSPSTVVGRSIEKIFKPVAKYSVNVLDAVIAVSDVPARYFSELYNGKIHIIPNGIDISRFTPKNRPFGKYRDGKVNILFLGRLDQRKGVLYLIKAYNRLKQNYMNARLLIAGDGEEMEKIKKYIKRKNLRDVEMLGFVREEDKPRWYATCDIFCSPALYGESFGIVLVEAMATGKPVVACSNPGYKTVLTGRGSLLLAEPKNISDLAGRLLSLCEDKELRSFMGEWGLRQSKLYSWEKVTDDILEIYDIALKRSKKSQSEKKKHKNKINEWITKMVNKINHYYS